MRRSAAKAIISRRNVVVGAFLQPSVTPAAGGGYDAPHGARGDDAINLRAVHFALLHLYSAV